MGNHSQSFDVCIICALPEEVRAFLTVVRPHCDDNLEEHTSPRYGYSYRSGALKNDKGEVLALHISWLPRYGPQEMTLHLSRVLEECQPRIAIMTGICAGDSQRVQLGDLVVAERTFTYDNGKFVLDEQGRSIHLHDALTYQLDANILQFLGLFDEWKPLVEQLGDPPSMPNQHEIVCHIKALASGSAVRADNPFQDVQAPVRGTVAIDMEGAAFGLVMSRHPQTRWLIVKGVCDYADRTKNDAYHDYAACASASYALRFIQAYVTNERLPRPYGPSSSSRAGPSSVWNVPYLRNPHFTGREELLDQLEQHLSPASQGDSTITRRAALTQTQAIKGLGGIGKTQIAVEYAYRSRDLGRYTHTLWSNAASEEALLASFTTLAELLPGFPAKDETDQYKLVKEIKRWLEQCEHPWLLIFDNADDVPIIQDYLPQRGNGSILITTRAHAVGSLATSVEVETMGFVEGTQLLLRRAQRFEQASDEEINQAGNIVVTLDHFPLALDQAGAYLEETQSSFAQYLDLYQAHRKDLLTQRGLQTANYPDSVATTWSLSFRKVEQANPAAAELLQMLAFLAPDLIPEELIRDGAACWSSLLQKAAMDYFAFNQMIAELLKLSLVKRLSGNQALSIHRLVQAVQQDMMEPELRRQWAQRVVRAVSKIFPDSQDIATWPQCRRYLDQVQECYKLVEQYHLLFIEAANLLDRVSFYLDEHALYTIAEPLTRQVLLMREQLLGSQHPDTADSLNSLAVLCQHQGKYTEAEPLLKHALSIREQILGTTHPDTALTLSNLAALYMKLGKFAKAEPLLKRALSIREQQDDSEHPDMALILDTLASFIALEQERHDEAEELYQRALSIREQKLGATHLTTAFSLNNLAVFYIRQGRYTEAEPLLKRTLSIREQVLGTTHPDTATSLDALAALYDEQRRYAEAEELYQRVLSIREQQLGITHLTTVFSLSKLANLYFALEKYTEAEPLLKRALSIREQVLGITHPDTNESLNILAAFYMTQRRYTEAEPLLKRALSIREQQAGPEHLDTAFSLNALGTLYHVQRRYSEAESLLKRALSICEQQLGVIHPNTVSRLLALADLYQAQGKYTEAESLLKRSISICEHFLDPEHSITRKVRENYAGLLRTMEHKDDVKKVEKSS